MLVDIVADPTLKMVVIVRVTTVSPSLSLPPLPPLLPLLPLLLPPLFPLLPPLLPLFPLLGGCVLAGG